ncbi:hypothetical protein SDC9_46603 [bioreactor metagenome]|uniref:Uncharacterized protein n=1 Tax=bioreactor metagenome TaxID=1076179 RepID=A0A644W9W4_9ZZZZ
MKKQILILAMVILALFFADTNMSFGQTYIDYLTGEPTCTPALPLSCATASGALNPTPGQVYNYSITTDPTAVSNVLWFVTDANTVISAGGLTALRDPGDGTGDYVLLGEAGVYNVTVAPLNTQKDIDISWQWFDGTAHEVLLVAYVVGNNGCGDNVEVWRIEPTFSFTLDLAALLDDGTVGDEECVSPVESATYTEIAGVYSLTMDYGENWVFFSVNAANFAHSWMPDLSAVVTGASTIGAVEWAYPADAQAAAGPWNATTVPILASAAAPGGVVGSGGECIVVRVEIQHGNNPTPLAAATETVTLSVNGIMYDAANANYTNLALRDVDEDTDGNCVQDITDTDTYTLLARPQITAAAPAPFEPKN